ncbi:hypothetical protein PFNF54_02385 [Plasmodium falciparum NF54]|uniref:Uncharacterized protein n=1 Tax=Plasmodium falciparum (isolate NF54) TaxID=5843 RepID=W7JW30_PLAFO|nr:hypothetical protein PFNF54_02385 [Plasmodium falciparum NF54]
MNTICQENIFLKLYRSIILYLYIYPPPCGNITFLYLDKHTSSQIYKVHIISSPPNLHTCNF